MRGRLVCHTIAGPGCTVEYAFQLGRRLAVGRALERPSNGRNMCVTAHDPRQDEHQTDVQNLCNIALVHVDMAALAPAQQGVARQVQIN